MANTIREDIVSIGFEVDDNPFKDITDGIEDMKKAVTGGVDDSIDDLKKMAKEAGKAADGVDEIKKSTKGLSTAKTKATELFKSLKNVAGVTFDKVTGGIKNIATQAGKATVAAGKGLAKGIGVGVGAAGAAIGGLVTQSVQAYADYEQLTGGVETLFKDSAPEVQKYANNAYKTAGLSANEYMETVTSFSASLLQSVGGDTAKAASKADVAITDMSDNANKMGSDIETLKTAYGGFAKGQFTLLDNLKLGYGGTKEEMQRLLTDAQKISGVKYDISSYADIVDAIHVVQTEMGITGTTAKEAEQTISGSLAGMKSAWGNLLTSLVQGGDSFDQNVANLISSVKTFAGNVMPVAKSALSGIVTLIDELAPVIIAELPSLISELLPQIVNAGMQLMQVLMDTIGNNTGMISSMAVQLITSFAQFILTSVPQLITTGMQLLLSLVQGISQQLPTLIPMAIQAITTLVTGLIGMLPQLISAGIELLVALVHGIVQSLPQLIPAGIQAVLALINGLVGAVPQLIQAALGLVPVIVDALIQNLPLLIQGGIQIIVALISGLGQSIPQLLEFMPQIGQSIVNSLKEVDLLQVGKDLVSGLIKGIGSMLGAVKDAAKNVAKGAANAIKGFLGINSPSKLMIEQGEFTGEGLALGIKGMVGDVEKAAIGLSAPIAPAVNKYTPSGSSTTTTNNNRSVVNHYSPQFTLNMNGASATEANKHKVKQWVKESMQEMFESMGRTNPELCEV